MEDKDEDYNHHNGVDDPYCSFVYQSMIYVNDNYVCLTELSLSSLCMSASSPVLPCMPPSCAIDVMRGTPHHVFSVRSQAEAMYGSVVCVENDLLVVTRVFVNQVAVVDISDLRVVSAPLAVEERPNCLALLHGLVAMTTNSQTIYLLKVTPTLVVDARIQTDRIYDGVAKGPNRHTLLVSCMKTERDPARVDVITIEGDLVRTVVDSTMLNELWEPKYLCVFDGCVLLSACEKDAAFKVDLATGQLVDTLTQADMEAPLQVCVDSGGNIYIAAYGKGCVVVRSRQGLWRRLVGDPTNEDCDRPSCVSVAGSGRLIVIWDKLNSNKLTCYDLK